MSPSASYATAEDFDRTIEVLRGCRDEILRDWLARVRENQAVAADEELSDPVLLDHIPQLFDAMLSRLEVNSSRSEAEQLAAVHGFSRRLSGYDVVEAVVELAMFRRAIWSQLTAADAPVQGAFACMERIDGMVDRAVVTSLQAFLDPAARMLQRDPSALEGHVRGPVVDAGTPRADAG